LHRQRSPSGYNLQPFKIVVVTDAKQRETLSHAMLNSNIDKVAQAPVLVVFAADQGTLLDFALLFFTQPLILAVAHPRLRPDPSSTIDDLITLEMNAGKPAAALTRAAFDVRALLGAPRTSSPPASAASPPHTPSSSPTGTAFGSTPPSSTASCSGGFIPGIARALASGFMATVSHLAPTPTLPSVESWSFKSTALAAQTLLLAATAHRLSSTPMEGFDQRRVRAALRIPDRYSVPLVIALGYAKPVEQGGGANRTARYPVSQVVKRDSFDTPWV
jgi:nitroreductase